VANVGIAITKFIAFLLTQSSSLLAESIHSLADSGNQLLLLLGGRRANRAADEAHPFGHGRERYIYAFVVSIVLFSLGGLFALYEGWHKVQHPEPITEWQWVPIAVLVVAIGLEGFSLRTAVVESAPLRQGRGWVEFVRAVKAPELPVVLLEDTAALAGLVFALFGVGLTLLTGDGVWDGVGTLLIGALLVCVAVVLAIEIKSLLVGEAATDEHRDAIEGALADEPGVQRVVYVKTLHVGPDELLVAAKVAIAPGTQVEAVAATIDSAERRIRTAVPIARDIFIEPDLWSDAAAERGPDTPAPPAQESAH